MLDLSQLRFDAFSHYTLEMNDVSFSKRKMYTFIVITYEHIRLKSETLMLMPWSELKNL